MLVDFPFVTFRAYTPFSPLPLSILDFFNSLQIGLPASPLQSILHWATKTIFLKCKFNHVTSPPPHSINSNNSLLPLGANKKYPVLALKPLHNLTHSYLTSFLISDSLIFTPWSNVTSLLVVPWIRHSYFSTLDIFFGCPPCLKTLPLLF